MPLEVVLRNNYELVTDLTPGSAVYKRKSHFSIRTDYSISFFS